MDWQLPDIDKTITNNILPGSLSAYAVRIGKYILSIGGSRLFPYRVALFPWIRIGLYIVRKIRFNNMNQVGHVLKVYFNRTNPQLRRQCKIITRQINHVHMI